VYVQGWRRIWEAAAGVLRDGTAVGKAEKNAESYVGTVEFSTWPDIFLKNLCVHECVLCCVVCVCVCVCCVWVEGVGGRDIARKN
jgi:hypothetical protein